MYKTNAKPKQKRKRMPDKLKCMRNVDHRLKSGTILSYISSTNDNQLFLYSDNLTP